MDTKDYGISVASRVSTHLAESLLLKAEKMGLTMSKYLSIQLATIDKKTDEIARLKKMVGVLEHNAKVNDLNLQQNKKEWLENYHAKADLDFQTKMKWEVETAITFIFDDLDTSRKKIKRLIKSLHAGEHRNMDEAYILQEKPF